MAHLAPDRVFGCSALVDGVRFANDWAAEHIAARVRRRAPGSVGFVGVSYKPGTGVLEGSPVRAILANIGGEFDFYYWDPNVEEADATTAFCRPARRVHAVEELLGVCDCIVLGHNDQAARDALAEHASLVDPW